MVTQLIRGPAATGAWPSREGEFADKFNSMPKYVVSSTLREPSWNHSTVIDGDLNEAVARLRQEHDGDIVVHGSPPLVQALLERDLVDEQRNVRRTNDVEEGPR